MTYIITVPAGTDRYGLVSDLQTMASDISNHLDSLKAQVDVSIVAGSSPTFGTISTTTAPTFPAVTITGTRPTSSIKNAANGFGFNSGSLEFVTTNSTSWTSSGHITIPDGGTGTQAINRNALDAEVTTLNATIAALTARVTALESSRATYSYVDSKDSTINSTLSSHSASITSINSALGSKANAYGALTKVQNSGYADSAGSAGSAGTANNATHFRNRGVAVGSFNAGSLSGGQSSKKTITHNLGYIPVVLAQAFNDDGVASILCSIETITSTNAVINYKNMNESTAETFSVNWVAI